MLSPTPEKITASALYAISQGGKSDAGDQECHWCAGKCPRIWKHDEPPLPYFVRVQDRARSPARRPANLWICRGCWQFRWKRVTLPFLSGGFKDGQCLINHSIWITEEGAWGIRTGDAVDREELYKKLLNPPLRFCLGLLDGNGMTNHLQLMAVNDNVNGVNAQTVLEFTVNNILHHYTPYELETALRHGTQGKPPGVAALVRLLGPYEIKGKDPQERGRGGNPDPAGPQNARKVVAPQSGHSSGPVPVLATKR